MEAGYVQSCFLWNADRETTCTEFILGLPQNLKAKAVRDIDILAERGNQLREPYSKHLQEGLFELRIQTSGDIARIFYFFFFVDETIILVNGFV